MMASTKITTSSSVETYNFFNLYSKDDIESVKRLQDEEQQRRIADIEGEKIKQGNAHRVSEMFSLNIRPTWFQKGSSYALNILRVARNAGNDILRSSQVRAINAKLQVAGQKSVATAQEVKNKSVATAQEMKNKIAPTFAKAQEASLETAHDVKGVMQETFNSAQGVAEKGIVKIQEAAKKFKRMSLRLVGKVNKAISRISSNTGIAFAVLEEENERAYRLNNEWESFAMMNAFKVSSMIKELAPAFYRPAFEPNALYAAKLLEDCERSRRMLGDLSDRTAINNAKAVAQLVEHKFRASTPSIAALVAAKAEVVEEIKVHKPIPATM